MLCWRCLAVRCIFFVMEKRSVGVGRLCWFLVGAGLLGIWGSFGIDPAWAGSPGDAVVGAAVARSPQSPSYLSTSVSSAPRDVSVVAGDRRVRLSWSAPVSDGGAPVLRYYCWYKPVGGSWVLGVVTSSRSCTVTDLYNGTEYVLAVRAGNRIGISSESNRVTATPTGSVSVSSAPRDVSVVAGDRRVRLSWSAPVSDGGAPVLRYYCWYKPVGGSWVLGVVTSARSCSVIDLSNGREYVFSVRAGNRVGISSESKRVTATPISFVVGSPRYSVTEGALIGTLGSAYMALDSYNGDCVTRSRNRLTPSRLAAVMLSIPVWEIASGKRNLAVSPMTLSRWDQWGLGLSGGRSNKSLYSHRTYSDEKRAHWNPGVGLWQLDIIEEALKLNHAERADTTNGGLVVAKLLRDKFCSDTRDARLKVYLRQKWNACQSGNRCYATYRDIYNEGNDSLDFKQVSGSDVDGGVQEWKCRWRDKQGQDSISWKCYLYNTDQPPRQGWMDTQDPEGVGSRTPLAAPFISFTHANTLYAVFPKSFTGYDMTLFKAVPKGADARTSKLGPSNNGWYNDTVNGKTLYVKCADPTHLVGTRSGATRCDWINTNEL